MNKSEGTLHQYSEIEESKQEKSQCLSRIRDFSNAFQNKAALNCRLSTFGWLTALFASLILVVNVFCFLVGFVIDPTDDVKFVALIDKCIDIPAFEYFSKIVKATMLSDGNFVARVLLPSLKIMLYTLPAALCAGLLSFLVSALREPKKRVKKIFESGTLSEIDYYVRYSSVQNYAIYSFLGYVFSVIALIAPVFEIFRNTRNYGIIVSALAALIFTVILTVPITLFVHFFNWIVYRVVYLIFGKAKDKELAVARNNLLQQAERIKALDDNISSLETQIAEALKKEKEIEMKEAKKAEELSRLEEERNRVEIVRKDMLERFGSDDDGLKKIAKYAKEDDELFCKLMLIWERYRKVYIDNKRNPDFDEQYDILEPLIKLLDTLSNADYLPAKYYDEGNDMRIEFKFITAHIPSEKKNSIDAPKYSDGYTSYSGSSGNTSYTPFRATGVVLNDREALGKLLNSNAPESVKRDAVNEHNRKNLDHYDY